MKPDIPETLKIPEELKWEIPEIKWDIPEMEFDIDDISE
jgi:hypothetical protein